MDSNPLFSVIIPTFNRKPFLKKALRSVLSQTFKNFELIIVDDGSTDDTRDLVLSYEGSGIKYIYQENRGPSSARNTGLNNASGQWMAFLDSDDWFKQNKLERFAQIIEENPDIKIFHSEELWFRTGKIHNPKKKYKQPDGFVYDEVLDVCRISISTAVVHKSIFEDIGTFDEDFDACEDYDFWLRVTHKYPVKLIEEYLTGKDGGRSDQLSSSVWGLDRFRIKALSKMLDSGTLSEKDYELTYKELERKCNIFRQGVVKRGRLEEAKNYQDLIQKYNT